MMRRGFSAYVGPVHPGEFLRDELSARGLSESEFAAAIGLPELLISEIIAGVRGITPETAVLLAKALGDDDPQYWINLDAAFYRGTPRR